MENYLHVKITNTYVLVPSPLQYQRSKSNQERPSFRFYGERGDVLDQIGNAVPVNLAEAIGKSVMESYRLGRDEHSL
jgi:site-specific DNA-cytosine methylase